MRDYTEGELQVIALATKSLESAVYGKWFRNLDRLLSQQLYDIHASATGWNTPLNTNCGTCMLDLLTSIGRKYFAQLEAHKAKVELKDVPQVEAQEHVKVTAKRKRQCQKK